MVVASTDHVEPMLRTLADYARRSGTRRVAFRVQGEYLSLYQRLIAIGLVTFMMTFIGLRLGGMIGEKVGRWAEGLGGVGLAVIGAHILFTHLGA